MLTTPSDDWLDPWIQQWGDPITRLAYLVLGDRERAQDVAQEVFLRLYEHHAAHPQRLIAVGWLYTVTRNLCRDVLRQQRRRPEVFGMDRDAPDSAVSWEGAVTTSVAIRQTLAELSPRDRECLWLYYYADLTVDDMAAALKLSPATIRTRLHRARHRFAKRWEGHHA